MKPWLLGRIASFGIAVAVAACSASSPTTTAAPAINVTGAWSISGVFTSGTIVGAGTDDPIPDSCVISALVMTLTQTGFTFNGTYVDPGESKTDWVCSGPTYDPTLGGPYTPPITWNGGGDEYSGSTVGYSSWRIVGGLIAPTGGGPNSFNFFLDTILNSQFFQGSLTGNTMTGTGSFNAFIYLPGLSDVPDTPPFYGEYTGTWTATKQ